MGVKKNRFFFFEMLRYRIHTLNGTGLRFTRIHVLSLASVLAISVKYLVRVALRMRMRVLESKVDELR